MPLKYIRQQFSNTFQRNLEVTGHLVNSGLDQEHVSKQTIQECYSNGMLLRLLRDMLLIQTK